MIRIVHSNYRSLLTLPSPVLRSSVRNFDLSCGWNMLSVLARLTVDQMLPRNERGEKEG